uniref:Tubulin-specific chaperone D n=1 Tax=Gouania willdenowi TaxID=441366 RepID=A0A8C5E9M2_GOUWI
MALLEENKGSPGADEGETDSITKACILDGFTEVADTRDLICSLPQVHGDMRPREVTTQKFKLILDRYQDQPHLLDPHLGSLLLEFVRNEKSELSLVHLSFQFLYFISKVRGFKRAMHRFPHEVADVLPVLNLLSQQDPKDCKTWETRYMLLLWLSMTCLNPFDFSRLDGILESGVGKPREPTMDRIMDIAKSYLCVVDSPRKAASLLVANFMTRPDVKQMCLGDFLDWSLTTISQTSDDSVTNVRVLDGVLQSLAKLFKHGKRDDLLQYAPVVLKCLQDKNFSGSSELLRKLIVKLSQRLGLTFLKPRLADWRYQRGSRSLAANLAMTKSAAPVTPEETPQEQEEYYDIPEEVESVIDHLLMGLRDKETIVRWSAAKGIGRLTGRLPKVLANEVVGAVLECFSFHETENAWHGGCLALAELGRRGLLMPSRLTEVVPLILKSLIYDKKRGTHSVGANVRDAACYVCWSFARAYEPKELKPYVNQIASSLLITAVFDRSINCRRAASGTFPHGIGIVTTADYYAVGNLSNCYLKISVYIAAFPEYTQAMIDHLVDMKINHWDGVIRELATKALHNLTPQAPDYMATTVLPKLLTMAVGPDLQRRHGAILACGEVTYALYKEGRKSEREVVDLISPECVDALKSIHQKVGTIELMRLAICGLIEKLSLSKMPFKNDPVISGWQWILDNTIETLHLVSSKARDDILSAVVSALMALCEEYYQTETGQADAETQVSRYINGLQSAQLLVRCGSALALGCLPAFMIHGKVEQVYMKGMCVVTQKDRTFSEARRDAIKSIAQVFVKAGVCANGTPDSCLCSENVNKVYELLLNSMSDYTTDSRGDIGAWVREAAMSSLRDLTLLISSSAPECMMACLAQQAAEKIDRYRAHAGNIFVHLLHSTEPAVPHIPHREELLIIFPVLDWKAPSHAFQYITQLLGLPEYQYHTLLGLTVSVGGITESTVQFSSQSLFKFLRKIPDNAALEQFEEVLLKVFRDHLHNDRCYESFVLYDAAVKSNKSLCSCSHPFCMEILNLCKQCKKTKDPAKLRCCISVFCGLIQFQGDVRKKVWSQLLLLLCHSGCAIRQMAADQMYEMLVTYDDVVNPEVLGEIIELLSNTNWQSDLNTLRPLRNQICDWLEVPQPQLISKVYISFSFFTQ